MNTLLIKLNATGDVVRTTTLLHNIAGQVTWITANSNLELLEQTPSRLRCLAWEQRDLAQDQSYDLVINLEDEPEPAAFVGQVSHSQCFGAYTNADGSTMYTDDSREWFDAGRCLKTAKPPNVPRLDLRGSRVALPGRTVRPLAVHGDLARRGRRNCTRSRARCGRTRVGRTTTNSNGHWKPRDSRGGV
jgi:hypothetical protein